MRKLLSIFLICFSAEGAFGQASATGSLSAPQDNNVVRVAQNCGTQTNCYTVNDNGQAAMTASYTAGGSGGSSGTLVSTHANDSAIAYGAVSTPTNYIGGSITIGTGVAGYGAIAAAFKISGTFAMGTCYATNETAASSSTITVSATITGGSGHVIIAFGRGNASQNITFSDPSNGTYTNAQASYVGVSGGPNVQLGYVDNAVAGTYTVTGTFGAASTYRAITVCEMSGLATSSPLDVSAPGSSSATSTVLAAGTMNTTVSDEMIVAASPGATAPTFSSPKVGTEGLVTTQSSDPIFAPSDVGKKFIATTNCDSNNGYINCTQSFPTGTIVAYVNSHEVQVSTLPSATNTSTGSNFSGWFLWGNDDTTALQNAWAAAFAQVGATLKLPCGMMFVDAPVFVSTGYSIQSPNIEGCAGFDGSSLVPTTDYASGSGPGMIYSVPNVNLSGLGGSIQTPFYWAKVTNLSVWGGGVDGSAFAGSVYPVFNATVTKFSNVWVTGWLWNLPNGDLNAMPIFCCTALLIDGGGGWGAGSGGLEITGNSAPSLLTSSARDCFFGAQTGGANPANVGYSLQLIGNGNLTTENCSFNPAAGFSSSGDVSAHVTNGWWTSTSDQVGGISSTAGTINLNNTQTTMLYAYGITNSGATIKAINSQIDYLSMSAGSFTDEGGNYTCATIAAEPCAGTISPWTANVHASNAITGGTLTAPGAQVNGACTGTATASSTLGLYGTGPNLTTTVCTSTTIGAGIVMVAAGNVSMLVVSAGTAGVNSSSGAVTVLKNGSATTITCTIGTGTACHDSTHSVSFVAGDLISLEFTTQSGETLANVKANVIY